MHKGQDINVVFTGPVLDPVERTAVPVQYWICTAYWSVLYSMCTVYWIFAELDRIGYWIALYWICVVYWIEYSAVQKKSVQYSTVKKKTVLDCTGPNTALGSDGKNVFFCGFHEARNA